MVYETRSQKYGGIGVEPKDIDFTIGTESANAIDVVVNIRDWNQIDISDFIGIHVWASDTAGSSPTTALDSIGVDGTNSLLLADIASVTNTIVPFCLAKDGATFTLTEADGADTFYLNVMTADGRIYTSSAITFAA